MISRVHFRSKLLDTISYTWYDVRVINTLPRREHGATIMINFETVWFEYSHGKKPRGYGAWAFEVHSSTFGVAHTDQIMITAQFGEAKKQLLARLKIGEIKSATINVLP